MEEEYLGGFDGIQVPLDKCVGYSFLCGSVYSMGNFFWFGRYSRILQIYEVGPGDIGIAPAEGAGLLPREIISVD